MKEREIEQGTMVVARKDESDFILVPFSSTMASKKLLSFLRKLEFEIVFASALAVFLLIVSNLKVRRRQRKPDEGAAGGDAGEHQTTVVVVLSPLVDLLSLSPSLTGSSPPPFLRPQQFGFKATSEL